MNLKKFKIMKLSGYLLTSCLLPLAIQTVNRESYDGITEDPCGNALNISDVRRNSNYTTLITDVDLCDDDLDFSKWYTFGNKLTSHCVENNKCGTASGIWIDGRHPTDEEIQKAYACSGDSKENCCTWKEVVYIKKCGTSFVYKLGQVFQCPMAYCVGDSIEDMHRGKERAKEQMLQSKKTFQRVVIESSQFGKRKLGFTIVGGLDSPKGAMGIYIKTISIDGLAHESGQLLKGDEIIAINGKSLRNLTHSDALSTIKTNKSNFPITFLIARRKILRRQASLPPCTFETISTIPEESVESEELADEHKDKIDISNLSLNLLAESDLLANEQEFSGGSDALTKPKCSDSSEPIYSHAIEDPIQSSTNLRKDLKFMNDFPYEVDKYLCVIPHKNDKIINDSSSISFLKPVKVENFDTTREEQLVVQQDLTTWVRDSSRPDCNSSAAGKTTNIIDNTVTTATIIDNTVTTTNIIDNTVITAPGNKITSFGSDIWNTIIGKDYKEPGWQLSENNVETLSCSETSDEGIALSNCGTSSKLKETRSFSTPEQIEFASCSDVFDDSFDSTASPRKDDMEWYPLQKKMNFVLCSEFGNDLLSDEIEVSHVTQNHAVQNSNNNNDITSSNIIDKLNTIEASQFSSETMNAMPESQNPRKVTFEREDSHQRQVGGLFKAFNSNHIFDRSLIEDKSVTSMTEDKSVTSMTEDKSVTSITEDKSVTSITEDKSVTSITESHRFKNRDRALEVAKYDVGPYRKVTVELMKDLDFGANKNSRYHSSRLINNKQFLSRTEAKDCFPNNHLQINPSNDINFHRMHVRGDSKENYSIVKQSNIRTITSIVASSKEPIFLDSKPTVRSDLLDKYRKRHEWDVRTFKPIHSRFSKSFSSLNWSSDLLIPW